MTQEASHFKVKNVCAQSYAKNKVDNGRSNMNK